MTEALDRRVRKTREALHSALAALVVAKGYDAVTIQDVLDAADVGRSTFYSHFTGKEALLRSGFERLRAELEIAYSGESGRPFGFVPALFDHAAYHTGLYAALLGDGGGAIARDAVREFIGAFVEREVDRYGLAADVRRDAAVAFLTGGLLSSLEHWAQSGRRSDIKAFQASLRQAACLLLAHTPPDRS